VPQNHELGQEEVELGWVLAYIELKFGLVSFLLTLHRVHFGPEHTDLDIHAVTGILQNREIIIRCRHLASSNLHKAFIETTNVDLK